VVVGKVDKETEKHVHEIVENNGQNIEYNSIQRWGHQTDKCSWATLFLKNNLLDVTQTETYYCRNPQHTLLCHIHII
jgi:hypothetical protein